MGLSDYDTDDYGGRRDRDDDDSGGPKDRDGDRDGNRQSYYDSDEKSIAIPDAPAKPRDAQLIDALIGRYFKAALAGNGAAICKLLLPRTARQVSTDPVLPPYAHGRTCADVMSKLFGDNHRQFVLETRALQAVHGRTVGNRGWVLLAFRGISTRAIAIGRRGGLWMLATTIDEEVP